jgi:hypothetical protein
MGLFRRHGADIDDAWFLAKKHDYGPQFVPEFS